MPVLFLLLMNLTPLARLAEQVNAFQVDLDASQWRERFEAASAGMSGMRSLEIALATLLDGGADRAEGIRRVRLRDPDNAVLVLLELGAVLADSPAGAAPDERYEAARELLEQAAATTDHAWYRDDAMRAWRRAVERSFDRAGLAAQQARDYAHYRDAQAIRFACGELLTLGGALAALGEHERAWKCFDTAVRWTRRSLPETRSVSVALTLAEQMERAAEGAALAAAAAGRTADADRAAAQRRAAARFHDLLRRRLESATHNPMLRNEPVLRPTPFAASLTYLLVSGFLAVGTLSVVVVGLLALAASIVWRVVRRGDPAPSATIGRSGFAWLWAAAGMSAPALLPATATLLFPLDPRGLMAPTWIQFSFLLTALLSMAVVLRLAQQRADAGTDPPRRAGVWHVWWAALFLFAALILLGQWKSFGVRPEAFDLSRVTPRPIMRVSNLWLIALLATLLAALIWLVWALIDRTRRGHRADRPGLLRAVVPLSLWGGLVLGTMTLGAFRLYYRYDARLTELTVQDLQDEVGAWMGPAWYPAFFGGNGGGAGG